MKNKLNFPNIKLKINFKNLQNPDYKKIKRQEKNEKYKNIKTKNIKEEEEKEINHKYIFKNIIKK